MGGAWLCVADEVEKEDIGGGSGGTFEMVLVMFVKEMFIWSLLEDTKSDSQCRGPTSPNEKTFSYLGKAG